MVKKRKKKPDIIFANKVKILKSLWVQLPKDFRERHKYYIEIIEEEKKDESQ